MKNYRNEIVSYCKSVIGCAYDYTPSGGVEFKSYNCSFLTYCAYKSAGLEIPTWQGHQNGSGSQSDWVRWAGNWKRTVSELKPADLVFFGSSPFNTYHVGVYVGDGQMIDSIPDGGVQQRFVYDTFSGGGWPFENKGEMEVDVAKLLVVDGVWMYFDGTTIHDLTSPEDIDALREVMSDIPTQYISEETYARLCESLRAGFPELLRELTEKYPPRSFK